MVLAPSNPAQITNSLLISVLIFYKRQLCIGVFSRLSPLGGNPAWVLRQCLLLQLFTFIAISVVSINRAIEDLISIPLMPDSLRIIHTHNPCLVWRSKQLFCLNVHMTALMVFVLILAWYTIQIMAFSDKIWISHSQSIILYSVLAVLVQDICR